MKDDDFLKLLKKADDNFGQKVETTDWIDSGSYIFNAALSGSMYKGFAGNRVTALAGEEAVGKTYFAMSIMKDFLDTYEGSRVVFFDTEFIDEEPFRLRGIDSDRVAILRPETVENFKTTALKFINGYRELKERPRTMFVLDSLGNMPSNKEAEDSLAGKHVRDMTKQQAVRSAFRTMTMPLALSNIPLILNNHTYQVVGSYIPMKEMAGGGGVKYAASTIVHLSKSKATDKTTKEVYGSILTLHVVKTRFSKEAKKVQTLLNFNSGIDRYYGLLPLAEKYGIFKKLSTQYEMPDGSKHFEKHILANPTKYYTPEILERLEIAAQHEFSLGDTSQLPPVEIVDGAETFDAE